MMVAINAQKGLSMQFPSVRTQAIALTFALSALVPGAATAQSGSQAHMAATPARARVTIENFGQISDTYYRGAQPIGHDYADLAALGIKTVIDLSDEQSGEEQAVEAVGMKFVRIPLVTTAGPPVVAVDKFLKLVNDPANQPVYVHCQGGRHRTGIMTAVYRMTHDHWTPDQAFAEMVQFQFKKGVVSHNALKQFVYGFPSTMASALGLAAEPQTNR